MDPRILEKKTLCSTKFLGLVQTDYLNKNGDKATWFHAERPNNTNAVMIVPVIRLPNTDDIALVCIREYRVPLQNYEIGFPAGLIDPGEDPKDTVARELLEETGFAMTGFRKPISPPVYNSAGLTNEAISIAYVNVDGIPVRTPEREASEEIEVLVVIREVAISHFTNRYYPDHPYSTPGTIFNHSFFGAKAWIILERFAETGTV